MCVCVCVLHPQLDLTVELNQCLMLWREKEKSILWRRKHVVIGIYAIIIHAIICMYMIIEHSRHVFALDVRE